MRLLHVAFIGSVLALASGCPASSGSTNDAGPTPVEDGGAQPANDAGTSSNEVQGTELMTRLAGLWSGPATMTPLGDFPVVIMDLRPVTPHAVFGRADLDTQNNLRFLVWVETIAGKDELVFRNGGYFQGVLRDSRTKLVEHDEGSGRYRFCSVTAQGCGYIDAVFDFDGDTTLTLDVKVKGAQHELWKATRKETRTVASPFPVDLSSQGDGTSSAFPAMPSAKVTVSWTQALAGDTDVVVTLSATACGNTGTGCTASRSYIAHALSGSTSVTFSIDQLHPGAYFANAVLDVDGNFQTTFHPTSGDRVAQPDTAETIATTGETAFTLPLVFTVP